MLSSDNYKRNNEMKLMFIEITEGALSGLKEDQWNFVVVSNEVFTETYLEGCERRERELCVFKREHKLFLNRNKQAKKHTDQQARYMFKGECGLEEQGKFSVS